MYSISQWGVGGKSNVFNFPVGGWVGNQMYSISQWGGGSGSSSLCWDRYANVDNTSLNSRASRSLAKTGSCWALFWSFFRGRKKCRKSGSKGSPNGPQKSTKIDRKGVLEGSQKGTSKMDSLQDQEKWDFAVIYCTLARSEVSKNTHFWVPFWGPFGRQNRGNRGPDEWQKK